MLIVRRRGFFSGFVGSYRVYIDGVYQHNIGAWKKQSFDVQPGEHLLQIRHGWAIDMGSPVVPILLTADTDVYVETFGRDLSNLFGGFNIDRSNWIRLHTNVVPTGSKRGGGRHATSLVNMSPYVCEADRKRESLTENSWHGNIVRWRIVSIVLIGLGLASASLLRAYIQNGQPSFDGFWISIAIFVAGSAQCLRMSFQITEVGVRITNLYGSRFIPYPSIKRVQIAP